MSTLSMTEAQAILRARGITPADYEGHRRYAAAGVLLDHGASCRPRGAGIEKMHTSCACGISAKSTEISSAEFRGLPSVRNMVSKRNQYIKGIRS